jgi:hypothetical protein
MRALVEGPCVDDLIALAAWLASGAPGPGRGREDASVSPGAADRPR